MLRTFARMSTIAVTALSVMAEAVGLGATAANAAASLTSVITTPENELYSAYATRTSPNGNIQAIPAYDTDRVVFVYADTRTYVVVADANGDIQAPRAVAFSPDGTTLFVANEDSTDIAIIDVASATVTGTFNGGDDEATTIGVSPDGTRIIVVADGNNVNIFDATANYALLGSLGASGTGYLGVFFTSNDEAWVADLSARADLIRLSDLSFVRSFDNTDAGGYGLCATSDVSKIVWVSSDNHAYIVDTADGSTSGFIDLLGITDSASMCTITNMNKLLISDYTDDPSQLLVYDFASLTLEQALPLPGLAFANGINVMNDCIALVEGYYTNIAVVALDSNICTKPDPELPNTGVDSTVSAKWMIGAGTLVGIGFITLVLARRRRVRF